MEQFEAYLLAHLPSAPSFHPHYEASLHQMLAGGGKRFRPALLLGIVKAYNPLLVQNAYTTPTNTLISNNVLRANYGGVIILGGGINTKINNNYLLNVGTGKGIVVGSLGSVPSIRTNISDNTCTTIDEYAIYINQPLQCVIKGNTITGSCDTRTSNGNWRNIVK